jgi:hypothetical protein
MNNTLKYLTAAACAGAILMSALPAFAIAAGNGGSVSGTGSFNNGGARAGNGGNGNGGLGGNGGNVTTIGSLNNGGASAGSGGSGGGIQSTYERIRPSR